MSGDVGHGPDRGGSGTDNAREEEARTRLFERDSAAREWFDHYTKADLYEIITIIFDGIEEGMQIWTARRGRPLPEETEFPTTTDSEQSNAG